MKILNDLYQGGSISKEQFDIYCLFKLNGQGISLINLWGEQRLMFEPQAKTGVEFAYEEGKFYLVRYIKNTVLLVQDMIDRVNEAHSIEKSLL